MLLQSMPPSEVEDWLIVVSFRVGLDSEVAAQRDLVSVGRRNEVSAGWGGGGNCDIITRSCQ